jgi:Polyketide cyclase / dehydrase and lipid transport
MPKVHVQVQSTLPPAEVLRVLTDFGPNRAEVWPGVDDAHLTVHDQGPNFADVTEGNRIGWERETYSWDADAGTISAVTTESNIWGPGSRWDYKLMSREGGTTVDITLSRRGKGIKGRLIGALLPIAGARFIKTNVEGALKRATS